jgi:hypothetical protein
MPEVVPESPEVVPAVADVVPEVLEASAPLVEEPPGTVQAMAEEIPPVREPADSRDDSSYPPVDLDTHFFDGSDRHSVDDLEHEDRDPRMALKLTPEVARRRADLQKYVKFAVAGASALCLAALVKVSLAHGRSDEGTHRSTAVAAAVAAPVQAPVEPAAAPVPAAAPPVDTAAAQAPAPVAAAAASPEGQPAASPDAPAATPDPVAAAKEKVTSRNALERGKNADAIEAGERSVALDPTDGEAWLILGAAYQAKGDMKNARRSYKACLEQGKRGPKSECAAMPH